MLYFALGVRVAHQGEGTGYVAIILVCHSPAPGIKGAQICRAADNDIVVTGCQGLAPHVLQVLHVSSSLGHRLAIA